MKFARATRIGTGIAIAALFGWLVIRQIRGAEVASVIHQTQVGWLVAALLALCVGYTCRIARWQAMLLRDNPGLRWWDCAGPLLGSFSANNLLPLRAGDIMRAFAFNARLGTSSGTVLASLLVERLLDLLTVLLVLASVLAIFGLQVSRFSELGALALGAVVLAIMVLLLFPQAFASPLHIAPKLISRVHPRFATTLAGEIDKCLMMLGQLSGRVMVVRLTAWSLAAWLAEGSVFWLAALSLPGITAPMASWLAFPVGTLATLIPSTPGYIGTFDYFTMYPMTELGNETVASAVYVLLVRALIHLPTTLAGGIYLIVYPPGRIVNSEVNNATP